MTIFVCNKCGWAHMGLSEDAIEESAEEFMQYYDGLDEEQRKTYYRSEVVTKERLISRQEHCFNCGTFYKNFHQEVPEDKIPDGCTIQGIRIPD